MERIIALFFIPWHSQNALQSRYRLHQPTQREERRAFKECGVTTWEFYHGHGRGAYMGAYGDPH